MNKQNLIHTMKKQMSSNIKQSMMIFVLIGISIIFSILTKGMFLSNRNLTNLMLQTSFTALATMGIVLVIVAGHIDLSVGSVVGFTGAIAAYLQVYHNWNTIGAVAMAVLAGLLIGAWHGYWISYKGIPAFIVTLSGMTIFRGALVAITKGQTIAPIRDSFSALGQGYLPRISEELPFHDTTLLIMIVIILIFNIAESRKRKTKRSYGLNVLTLPLQVAKQVAVSLAIIILFSFMVTYRGIPIPLLIVLFFAVIYSFIANRTAFGRYVYAIGGNKEAARYSGINIKKTNLLIFISMGFVASLSGVLLTARLSSAASSTGMGFELDVIASAIIGGTNPLGGIGTIIGGLIGALIMASINNGMSLMNMSADIQMICRGLVLLLAVWFDISSKKR